MANKLQLNFSGGINRKVSPLLMKDEESELIVNYNLDKIGALTKRKGYSENASAPVADKPVLGLAYTLEGTDMVMAANNSGDTNNILYYKSPTATSWTSNKTDDSTPSTANPYGRVRFKTFIGRVFRVNGVQKMASSASANGTWGTTSCAPTVDPNYIELFQDRMYVACDSSPTFQNRVWFSSLPSTTANSITWDETNDWFDVNPDDGDVITGLANNGNRLLIFKSKALYRWSFGQVEPDRLIGVGAVNQEVIQTNFDVGITFFANSYGVYAYSGGRPKLISRKIQDIIDAVTESNWYSSCAGVDEDHYYLSVGDVTIDGRLYSNVVLCYHISMDAWTIYTFAHRPNVFATMPLESTDNAKSYLFFGATNGKVYQMNSGYADDTSTISTYFRSKEYLLSFPDKVTLDRVDVFALNQGGTRVSVEMDRSVNPELMPSLSGRVSNLRPPTVRTGNTARIYFMDNSTTAAEIEGFNLDFSPLTRRDEPAKKTRTYGNG